MDELAKNALVGDALKALLYEVSVNPKPGLVDPVSSGPHPDMDVFTFIDSTVSLRQYFTSCVGQGAAFHGDDLRQLFGSIRPIGVQAEHEMFAATNGVNTHKGAIFSLGILVTAEAYRLNHQQLTVTNVVQLMLRGLTASDFKNLDRQPADLLTAGERQYLRYGTKGIRGEAETGYPTVISVGLPTLRAAKGNQNQRLLDTLMMLVGHSVDTNLVKRAGNEDVVEWAHVQAKRYFDLGGSQTEDGMAFLTQLNQTFTDRNLSLGGSADLLILTIFLGLREGII
ncbi:triphosphoribosyl-dephospho-CoA synthase [Secundilactobacillus folii]|uniref:Probable 2-(5''-triphosphoribosyl)-3'-dephosphocoenzyme-A synthase n=1 Tax=Secundilactobacillus folii TaxID=2678357 RepID=A0A7X2XV05_9LACO|nr:triphosphoribosyl-dephospho-CoA synthase [Secundilactobacillus folii]MTV82025.1 triphosphoribosyl-dephospho-CoA synthase [Secundilactobacillus folii]